MYLKPTAIISLLLLNLNILFQNCVDPDKLASGEEFFRYRIQLIMGICSNKRILSNLWVAYTISFSYYTISHELA